MRHAAYFYYPNDEPVLYIAIISPDNRVRFFTERGTEACSTAIPLEMAIQHGRFVQLGVTNRKPQPHSKHLPTQPLPPRYIGGRRTIQPYFDPSLGCWRSHDTRNGHKLMKKTLLILTAALWSLCVDAATVTLMWNPSTGATAYRLYSAEGTSTPFGFLVTLPGTSINVTVNTNVVTRYYVTAVNSVGESGPSNVVTNNPATPAPTGPILVLIAPTLSSSNIVVGQTLTVSAVIRNDGDGDFVAVDGSLTLLPPGGTRADGPYIGIAPVAQTVKGHTAIIVSGTWVAALPVGTYNAYIVVKDAAGTWTASGFTPFVVSALPLPTVPPAPTNLRINPVNATRLEVLWDSSLLASTDLERSKETEAFKRIAIVAPGTMRYTDNIQKHRDYRYRARAMNVSGLSDYSNVASFSAP